MPWAQPLLSAKGCAGQHKQQILAGLCLSSFSKHLPLLHKKGTLEIQTWPFAEFAQLWCPSPWVSAAPRCAPCWGQVRIILYSLSAPVPTLVSAALIIVG